MIFPLLLQIVQLCTAQIHPELWTIPIIIDEQGNLCFGDPSEQNETTQMQPTSDEPQLTGKVPIFVDMSPVHEPQPQAISTLLREKSLLANFYQPPYTFMHSAEVHQNIADPELHQRETSFTLSQEQIATDMDTESIDADLETLLAYGNLGPLSVDVINIEPLSAGTEMEISLNDTPQVRNASLVCINNMSDPRSHPQIQEASFYSNNKKIRNVGEHRDSNLAFPGFSNLTCGQPFGSFQANFAQTPLQSGFSNNHFLNQTGQKPYKCDMCQKHFHTSGGYQIHRRAHTREKPFQCDICPKQFHSVNGCRTHQRKHTGEKPFKCVFCKKKFSDPSNYRRHRRIHTGEKPFQCDTCPKQFRTSTDYQTHQRIHTGEKPFKCDFCHREFRGRSHYLVHRRIHIGEKPFQCDLCPKKFRTSGNYQTHRRIHDGEKIVHLLLVQSEPFNKA